MVFRIVTNVTIVKNICGIDMGYILIFNHITRILNIALLVVTIVHQIFIYIYIFLNTSHIIVSEKLNYPNYYY